MFRSVLSTLLLRRSFQLRISNPPRAMSDIPTLDSSQEVGRDRQDSDTEPESKRKKLDTEDSDDDTVSQDRESGSRVHKRKCALLLSFCGKDYKGMQWNPGVETIEEDLIQALYKAGAINEQMRDNLGKLKFQRCARTDKGVSAARQLVSLKMVPETSMVQAVNAHLPQQIRIMKLFRTTRGFNSKEWCSSRTYEYFLPTYALCSNFKELSHKFRVSLDVIAKVNDILSKYCGTHNFHNFTSGRRPGDPSCKRYIISFECGAPRLLDDVEYLNIMVQGQSFMLHQIRKMIGLMLAILRGFTSEDIIPKSFAKEKVDIPRAPGLYLILDNVHFDRYNKKFGEDGLHEPLDWSSCEKDIQEFKDNYIYKVIHDAELESSPMTEWLATLNIHTFFDPVVVPQLPSPSSQPPPNGDS